MSHRRPLGEGCIPRREMRPRRAPVIRGEAEVEITAGTAGGDLADGHGAVPAGNLSLQGVEAAFHRGGLARDPAWRLLARRAAGLDAPQRGGPAAGNSLSPACRLSRYSQITGESKSAVPSSRMRVGTLPIGLSSAISVSGDHTKVGTRSIRGSSPVS